MLLPSDDMIAATIVNVASFKDVGREFVDGFFGIVAFELHTPRLELQSLSRRLIRLLLFESLPVLGLETFVCNMIGMCHQHVISENSFFP